MRVALLAMAALLAGCSTSAHVEKYTLYRNSPFQVLRVHWATFDSAQPDSGYNRDNCEMAARLLNANVAATRKANGTPGDSDVGFWCEAGDFVEKGSIPGHFEAQFPTDVQQ